MKIQVMLSRRRCPDKKPILGKPGFLYQIETVIGEAL
jgi:hypothetical protein